MEPGSKVEHREIHCASRLIQDVGNVGERVCISYSPLVKVAEVDDHSPPGVPLRVRSFRNNPDGRIARAVEWFDNTIIKLLLDVLCNKIFVHQKMPVLLGVDRYIILSGYVV